MASSCSVPRLSEAQEASLRNMSTFESTLWARMDKYFDNVAVLPPQLLPRNSGVDWERPNQVTVRLLSQLICIPLFQSHPQLIPIGLEITRYYRLCHFSTLHSATTSTHPSIVSACQSMNEDVVRIQLADAIRLASPLGEIFLSPPTSDFLLKCKILSMQSGSTHRGKHGRSKAAIITADVELLVKVWDSYALECKAGEKSTESYAQAEGKKPCKVKKMMSRIIENKRRWLLSHLENAPQDYTESDSVDGDESDVEYIDGEQVFLRGDGAVMHQQSQNNPAASETRKRRRQQSNSPTRNTRQQMSPRHVPSDAAPMRDLAQMSHSQLQKYEKQICSQLPVLQSGIEELRGALGTKIRQKSELMARLAHVNQLLTNDPSQRSEIVRQRPTARDNQTSASTVNKESSSDMVHQKDNATPNLEHGTNRVSQELQPTKSPSHEGLSPKSGQKVISKVRSLKDNSSQPKSRPPPKNASQSQLLGSFLHFPNFQDSVLESIESPDKDFELTSFRYMSETSPQDKSNQRGVDQEAENQTPLLVSKSPFIYLPSQTIPQKTEQSPASNQLQTTPGAPQPKPRSNDEYTSEQPLYKAPAPTWNQSNMTATTPRQRFELVHYRLEKWIEANPASTQREIDGYFVRGLDTILTQLQEESGKSVEEFAEARGLAKLEVLSIAEGFYNGV